ncbi:sugar phosphate isomerase/epimerase family protein [Labilibacter marinus]|uniref:sugar phosphate isomerase/epimerase family protein n=1 Tax=Labilibacter marinus TaxID=1477105 RepID=UPI000836E876|nr:TIM barrel protein [Labilibacter marinus]
MEIKYICPFWGSEDLRPKNFIEKALDAGYDGVEMNAPSDEDAVNEIKKNIQEKGAVLIAQQWLAPAVETVDAYRDRMLARFKQLVELNPVFINSHTGKDFFSFEENSSLLKHCEAFTEESQVPIVHETHRGRFNYHAYTLLPYLNEFKDLQLNADFSHFCNVSESLLEDQEDILEKIMPHCKYIHARVGFDQSAQVNDPFAPEWKANLDRFVAWWQKIIDLAKERGEKTFYVCPEFGPFPYMPQLPYTRRDISDQWGINKKMMEYLRKTLH